MKYRYIGESDFFATFKEAVDNYPTNDMVCLHKIIIENDESERVTGFAFFNTNSEEEVIESCTNVVSVEEFGPEDTFEDKAAAINFAHNYNRSGLNKEYELKESKLAIYPTIDGKRTLTYIHVVSAWKITSLSKSWGRPMHQTRSNWSTFYGRK